MKVLRMRTGFICVAVAASLGAGCRADAEKSATPVPVTVQVGPENVVTVKRERIVLGPLVSGELRAAREATVRAQLGGSMLQVLLEEGEPVRQGALLGRIETKSLGDTRRSAESALKSAESQLTVARREAERTSQLVKAGALAARDLEVAASNVTAAEAQVADARARLQTAGRQLGDAVIRAPFTGIVADKAVNVGDVVAPGTPLFTIIDPSSMRLEASVPSDELALLKIGAPVQFTVRGYEQPFEGRIDRISPQADPTTRQVAIFVSVANTGGRLVAGLFAEGRVVSETAEGLVVPLNAVNTVQDTPWIMRVAGGKAEKVNVTLGLRDPRTERVQIVSGVNQGDMLLRGAAQAITPGTPVAVGGTK
ncbi:efflux RND transporter periplasmic adaptor subunit [soil metagenome]